MKNRSSSNIIQHLLLMGKIMFSMINKPKLKIAENIFNAKN